MVQSKAHIWPFTLEQGHIFNSTLLKLSYLVSFCGVILDQLSTRIGLTHPQVFETNMYASYLMGNGIWLHADILALLVCISVSYIFIKRSSFKFRFVIMFLPFTFGFLKVITGISNLILYFSLV